MRIDYVIGLRSGDIADYSPPSEKIYLEIFNRTGLETFVHIRYVPRSSNEISLNNEQSSLLPFDYRSSGPFYGVNFILKIDIFISPCFLLVGLVDYTDYNSWYSDHLVNPLFSLLHLFPKTV